LVVTPARAAQTLRTAEVQIAGVHSVASNSASIDFADTASRTLEERKNSVPGAIHRPLAERTGDFQDGGEASAADANIDAEENSAASSSRRYRMRRKDFPAGADNGAIIPPDTQGTVGPNHLMVVLNSNVTIETRTGIVLRSVPIASFWSSLGGINEAFDPRVLFDRYANRWIISADRSGISQ
jgi:hypothetical protein